MSWVYSPKGSNADAEISEKLDQLVATDQEMLKLALISAGLDKIDADVLRGDCAESRKLEQMVRV